MNLYNTLKAMSQWNGNSEGQEPEPAKVVGRFCCTTDLYSSLRQRCFTAGRIYIGFEVPKGLGEFELVTDQGARCYITAKWSKYFEKQ